MEGLQPDEDVQLVIDLELRLLEPQVRASAGELDRLLHPGFTEFGASGRKWDRSEIIASLTKEQPPRGEAPVRVLDITGTRLAGSVVHVTYLSLRDRLRPPRFYLAPDKCGMAPYFHQGTLTSPPSTAAANCQLARMYSRFRRATGGTCGTGPGGGVARRAIWRHAGWSWACGGRSSRFTSLTVSGMRPGSAGGAWPRVSDAPGPASHAGMVVIFGDELRRRPGAARAGELNRNGRPVASDWYLGWPAR